MLFSLVKKGAVAILNFPADSCYDGGGNVFREYTMNVVPTGSSARHQTHQWKSRGEVKTMCHS